MSDIPSMTEMLKSGVHFGHKNSRRHPKMDPYIYLIRNRVHIIDLEKTTEKLKEALAFINETVSKGGTVLFLGTKRQAHSIIQKYAKECNMPFITTRWLGGTITNFEVISKVIKKFNQMKSKKEAGEYEKYTKKEQLDLNREIERLENMVGGIANMNKLPDIIYIIDIKNEKTAVIEAKRKNILTVAICDTNVNPENVTYPIPANDDATKSIEMITRLISEEIKSAQGKIKKEIPVMEESKEKPTLKAEEISETEDKKEPKEETVKS